jgi:hypothetical protein
MIKLTEILKKIFINEYNKSQLDYIALKLNIPRTSDFESILSALDAKGIKYPELKDKILKGEIKTLEDLETLRGAPKRIKAGKINTGEADANLVYNQDGLRVYWAKDKNACVKYGNGYSFCISSRGNQSSYYFYKKHNGTPYFIFDDTKTSDRKDNKFIDPTHLLVVFVNGPDNYAVTPANNPAFESEENFSELISIYPRLSNLKNILIEREISKKDQKIINMYDEYEELINIIDSSKRIIFNNTWSFPLKTFIQKIVESLNTIIEFQKGNLSLYGEYEIGFNQDRMFNIGYDLDKMLKDSWWYNTQKYKITKEGNKTKVYIEPYDVPYPFAVGSKHVGARVIGYEKIPYNTQEIANLNPILEKFINFYKKYNIKSKNEMGNI